MQLKACMKGMGYNVCFVCATFHYVASYCLYEKKWKINNYFKLKGEMLKEFFT